jgi:AAA domain
MRVYVPGDQNNPDTNSQDPKPPGHDEPLLVTLSGPYDPRDKVVRLRPNGPAGEPFFPNGKDEPPPNPARILRGGDFMAAYRPISYTIEDILPSGYLYGLTARRGGGKTALLTAIKLGVETGNEKVLGCEVTRGRVAYVSKENPDDFRMKLVVNCYYYGLDHAFANQWSRILDGRADTPEAICEALKRDAGENGPFQLICYDTFQAGFAACGGEEFNNNAEVLKFILRLRPLAETIGKPSVLIAFHPTKNATEDELFPYGGGAIMNEIDGNLTLWSPAPYQIKLHFNRVRGPEFEPKYFHIEKMSAPQIVDIKGREILLPVLLPTTLENVESRKRQEEDSAGALLRAMAVDPGGSQGDWATATGVGKGTVNRTLKTLEKEGFVSQALGKWQISRKGKKIQ